MIKLRMQLEPAKQYKVINCHSTARCLNGLFALSLQNIVSMSIFNIVLFVTVSDIKETVQFNSPVSNING